MQARIIGDFDSYEESQAITLDEARQRLRGRQGPLSLSCLRAFCRTGCEIRGQRIKLFSVKASGCRKVMPEWLKQFEKARFEANEVVESAMSRSPTPKQRRRSAQRADKEAAELLAN